MEQHSTSTSAITHRFATEEDVEFVLEGRYDVYVTEKYSLDQFDPEEERRISLKAITNQNVIVAEIDRSSYFYFSVPKHHSNQIFTDKVGYVQFQKGEKTPFGVDYGQWFNKYLWIDFVYVKNGTKKVRKALILIIL